MNAFRLARAEFETFRQILRLIEQRGEMHSMDLMAIRETFAPFAGALAVELGLMRADEYSHFANGRITWWPLPLRLTKVLSDVLDRNPAKMGDVVGALRAPAMQAWALQNGAPHCCRCGFVHVLPHCEQCWQLMQPNLTTAQFKAQSFQTDEWDRKSTLKRDEWDAETLLKLCQLSMPPVDAETFEKMTGIKLAGITKETEHAKA